MKQNFYKITASNRFQAVIQFLRKELGWKAGDPLVWSSLILSSANLSRRIYQFTYINLAFSPAPDDTVSNLFKVRDLDALQCPKPTFYAVFFHRRTLNSQLQASFFSLNNQPQRDSVSP